jgi:chromosome condensin MukBEF ATPase and DNA-binding subunit MukB
VKTTPLSKFRRIILVNWRDLPYAQIDLDSNVTVFEGGNGSGKTTIMLAALATLMPDKKQLRSRKVSTDKHAEEGIFHRLQMDEPIAYAGLEIELRNERVLAAVQITKQRESSTIDLHPFTIRAWPDKQSIQNFFRVTENDREWTCNLSELKQRAGEWGVHLNAHPTLSSYFKELYDVGALPLAMATDAERSQYAHLLETSMAGGLSAELAVKLKQYLLPEYEKLPSTVKLMHDNYLACVETQSELETSEQHYRRIGDLFQSLTGYVRALGTRVESETISATEKLKATERDLTNAQGAFTDLEAAKKKWESKKTALETERRDALSELKATFGKKANEQDECEREAKKLKSRIEELQLQLAPVNNSKEHLNNAIFLLKTLFPEINENLTRSEIEARLKAEDQRLSEEIGQLNGLKEAADKERAALKNQHGVSSELLAIANKLGATPVVKRYADVNDLPKAARLQAKLGPLVKGLIVKDTKAAIQKLITAKSELQDVWLTQSQDPGADCSSESSGDLEIVEHALAVRVSRVPKHPILGDAAREAKMEELRQQSKRHTDAMKELVDVKDQMSEVLKHAYRVADEHRSASSSSLSVLSKSLTGQITELETRHGELSTRSKQAQEAARAANSQMDVVLARFNQPEEEINSELSRNHTALALNELLRKKLTNERTDGIALHANWKPAWDEICNLPELSGGIKEKAPDIGASLERLRSTLNQIPNHVTTSALLPEIVGEEIPSVARRLPTLRGEVLKLIQSIQPHDLTESDDPALVVAALTQRISGLNKRLEEQQANFRTSIDAIANAIHSEIHKRAQAIIRWSADLKEVQFGTVRGIRLTLQKVQDQLDVLEGLRQQ